MIKEHDPVVLNRERTPQAFNLRHSDQGVRTSLPAGAVGTFVW
jgi:O-glycosyl hydrolase